MNRSPLPAALTPPIGGSAAQDLEERTFLVARIGSKRIAFDMRQVREVGSRFDWITAPNVGGPAPEGFVGLKNIRGTVVPVLEPSPEPRGPHSRLIVLRQDDGLRTEFVSIVVDRVIGIRPLLARDISRPRLPEPDGAIAYLHFGEEDCVPLHAPSSLLRTTAVAS